MGTTVTTAIPYVEPTDTLANYPTQDKAKADRLEVLLADTGWVNLTPRSGTGTFRYRAMRGFFFFQSALSGVSIPVNNNIQLLAAGIIPTAYRPPVTSYSAGSNAGSGLQLGVVNVDGSVQVWNPSYNSSTSTVARFMMIYPIEVKP